MSNRMTLLLAFLAAFMFASPAAAAPPEEDAKAEEKADDAEGAEDAAPTEEKADEVAAPEDAEEGDEPGDEPGADDEEADEKVDGPAEIESDEEAMDTVSQLVAAAKEGHWSLVVAFSIMLLVYLLNRFGVASKLGQKAVPWVAAGTGVLGYVAAYLMVEGATIVDGVTNGVMAGAAAVGLWELLFKHFLGNKGAEDSASSS